MYLKFEENLKVLFANSYLPSVKNGWIIGFKTPSKDVINPEIQD